jgi:hypothetical protein
MKAQKDLGINIQMQKAKEIAYLAKILTMRAKRFAENPKHIFAGDLGYVLNEMKELEKFLK